MQMDLEKLICSALDLLRPAISDLLLRKSGKKGFYWVILDPKTGAVAVTGKYGEPDDRHDYAAIALSKANQAWGSGLPNRLIPPTALEPGDTPYYGSWVCEGIACGVSGVGAMVRRVAVDVAVHDNRGDGLRGPPDLEAAESRGGFPAFVEGHLRSPVTRGVTGLSNYEN